jgi:hypothetical protein
VRCRRYVARQSDWNPTWPALDRGCFAGIGVLCPLRRAPDPPYHRLVQADPQDEQTGSSGGSDEVVQGPTGDPEALAPANQEPRYPVPPAPGGAAPRSDEAQPPAFTPPPPPDDSAAAAHAWNSDDSPAADSWSAGATQGEAHSTASDEAKPEVHATRPDNAVGGDATAGTEAAPVVEAQSEVAPVAAPPSEPDHMAGICPYFQSQDGSYHSVQPAEGHRCTAQEPLGTLPLAFQERFCLTDRYARCEMYKYAQEVNGADATGSAGVAVTATQPVANRRGSGESRRPALIVAAGMGGILILVVLMLLLFGGDEDGESGGSAVASASPEPVATETAEPEPTPEPEVTPEPTPKLTLDPDGAPNTDLPGSTATIPIRYQVQEGEQLLRIAETFGVSRRRVLRANPGMEDLSPYVQSGDEIIVPASSSMTIEEMEAVPGYLGLVEP